MNPALLVEQAVNRCKRLGKQLEAVDEVPNALAANLLLKSELSNISLKDLERPPVILFAGGTGVGKSALFAELVGIDSASVSSGDKRPFTRVPNIAAIPEDRFLKLPDSEAKYVDGIPGLVLVDAPDIDSAVDSNRDTARLIVEQADVVVYVTIPDKRANFEILQEMRQWGPKVRWLFVLNKADLLRPEDVGNVREDLLQRLQDNGFNVRENDCFLTSATDPTHAHSELARLRSTLFSVPHRDLKVALKAETVLRRLSATLDELPFRRLQELSGALSASHQELKAHVHEVYLEVLKTRKTSMGLKRLVREAGWRELPPRIHGPLALSVWMRTRLSNLWLTYSVARLSTAPLSVFSWLRLAMSGAGSMIQGVLPLRTLLHSFQAEHWRQLAAIEHEAVRRLEDLGFDVISPPLLATAASESAPEASAAAENAVSQFLRMLREDENMPVHRVRREIAELLDEAVALHAEETAERVASWIPRFFGNLLPWAALLHFSWRLVIAWRDGLWLAPEFYLHGIMIFIMSLVPGWLLISVRMKALAVAPEPERVLEYLRAPVQTEVLRDAQGRCESLTREIDHTRRQIKSFSEQLERTLEREPGSTFG